MPLSSRPIRSRSRAVPTPSRIVARLPVSSDHRSTCRALSTSWLPVRIGPLALEAELCLPPAPRALVVIAPGSGTHCHDHCHLCVTLALRQQGLGVLLFEMLTPQESVDRTKVFDIDLLRDRLIEAIDWSHAKPELADLPIGLYGAETGGAAVLAVAAANRNGVFGVVSRGCRTDMVMSSLSSVRTPTLLIASDGDPLVLALNRVALERLQSNGAISVISSSSAPSWSTALYERVAKITADWFATKLPAQRRVTPQQAA